MDAQYFIEKLNLLANNIVTKDDGSKGLYLDDRMVKKLTDSELETLKEIKNSIIKAIEEESEIGLSQIRDFFGGY